MLIIIVLIIAGCKKSSTQPVVDNTPDYSPMTAGSTWTYELNTGQTYTLTATNKDTVAAGRTYKVFTNSAGPNAYRNKSVNEYYRFGIIEGVNANGFEELYLKDNQDVNGLWQTVQTVNVPGIPLPLIATLKYTIAEKGISRTVNGKNYANIIHIRMDVSVANYGSIGGGDFYYANKVGLIEDALLLTAQGQVLTNTSEKLITYTIK